MSNLLAVPFKKPSDVDIVKPLKNLIQSAYNTSESPVNSDESVNEFSSLRSKAVWKVYDKNEAALELNYQYLDQLCSLETKIPIHELQIPFKWKDAFDKGSIFGGKMSLTLSSLPFEKLCVLFNIAALQSAVASVQNQENDDNLKLAAKLFQQSAGIFHHLKTLTPSIIQQEPTPDLTADTLTTLQNLMLAQAQEIFIYKAACDNIDNAILSKLSCQCEELYAEVLRGVQKEAQKNYWEKEWIPTISGKQAGFQALTSYYQSLVCRKNKSFGEEIARLTKAVELFKSSQARSGRSTFDQYMQTAQKNLTQAIKDNDFIYNDRIPDINSLTTPGKVQLAKMIPVGATRMSTNFKDLFVDLVPVKLHQALSMADNRKKAIVNAEVMKLREATNVLNTLLSDFNLPAAVEVKVQGSSLPRSLLEKSVDVREKGGVNSIHVLINELPELLTRNREILDETERMLNDESDSDKQLRQQFKERWTRKPSDELTEMFRANAGKYREIINNALTADKVVRDKFDAHIKCIDLLSKSQDELQNAVPASAGGNVANTNAVQKLRQLMEAVDTIKAERDAIENELQSATVDMKEQFLQALAQDGAINEPALSIAQIGKTLQPLQNQVAENLNRQATLINDIKEANSVFCRESNQGSDNSIFCQLAAAYDVFIELQNNLKEGTKFYNDLTQLLVVFQNKISDFCFARKTEKEELMKDLTQQTSRGAPASTPSIPKHHESGPSAPATGAAPPMGNVPYPTQIQGMPVPYGATAATPYPTYMPPPMPQSFNPYATLPYPSNFNSFPQYATYPGNYAHQQQQPGFPQQQQLPGYPQQPMPGYPQQQMPPGYPGPGYQQ